MDNQAVSGRMSVKMTNREKSFARKLESKQKEIGPS
jgi:hypothetical protein